MADTNNKLPEGTDTVIEAGGTGGSGGGQNSTGGGRSGTSNQGGSPSTATNSTGGRTSVTSGDSQTDALITGNTGSTGSSGAIGSGGSTPSSSGPTGGSSSGSTSTDSSSSSGSSGGIRGIVGNVTTKARDEATNRARGFVGDGLKSGSATLGNVANIIEDTIEQIGERLGPQYADYARTASQTINRYATTLENKDPDELVDDARELIRKSPGVALTGAAILGFGLVRLLKVGMPQEGSNGTSDRQGDRAGTTR